MDNVFIISDNQDIVNYIIKEAEIKSENIIYFQHYKSETEIHEWLYNNINSLTKIEKLIIPLALSLENEENLLGLKLALHLRLHYKLPIALRTIPIIILSEKDFENIVLDSLADSENENNYHHLLCTPGLMVAPFDKQRLQNMLSIVNSCSEADYKKRILDHLKIAKKESSGKHSIANAWGCYQLAKISGHEDAIKEISTVSEKINDLYTKYLICYQDSFLDQKGSNPDNLPGLADKKILYIDDQADEGWGILLKEHIFKNAGDNFVYIDPGNYKNTETKRFFNYQGFLTDCEDQISKEWDLILLDLRLNPEVEDIDNVKINPDQLSGFKLLDKFLKFNEGYQIVVLTASNKIWNLNAALHRGANSFYIKESPEFNHPIELSKKYFENLKKDVETALKAKYLFEIYEVHKMCNAFIDGNINQRMPNYQNFYNTSKASLEIAFELLKKVSLDQKYLNLAFLTYFQIIEDYVGQPENFKIDSTTKDAFVDTNIQVINRANKRWELKFINGVEPYSFFEKNVEQNSKVPTSLAKISFVLAFKFSYSNIQLKDWGRLNDLRNSKAAHGTQNGFVSIDEVKELLEVVKLILINN